MSRVKLELGFNEIFGSKSSIEDYVSSYPGALVSQKYKDMVRVRYM